MKRGIIEYSTFLCGTLPLLHVLYVFITTAIVSFSQLCHCVIC